MKREDEAKQYRIGEYSAYMGVTPDFLKHYEQCGLITSVVRDNGYHYYPFSQCYKILECMRLRNYGISIKDMNMILHVDDLRSSKEKLDEQVERMEAQLKLMQAVIEEHKKMSVWLNRMKDRKRDWYVMQTGEKLFLPHSNGYDFLTDEKIYAILKDWVSWMPMVKSCKEISLEKEGYSWGLLADRKFADDNGFPVNEAVKTIPARKCFIYNFAGAYFSGKTEINRSGEHEALRQIRRMGLEASGEIYKIVLMYTHVDDQPEQYGYYMIPLKDE